MFLQRITKRYTGRKLILLGADLLALTISVIFSLSLQSTGRGVKWINLFDNLYKLIQFILLIPVTIIIFRFLNLYKEKVYNYGNALIIQTLKGLALSAFTLILSDFFIRLQSFHRDARISMIIFVLGGSILVLIFRKVLITMWRAKNANISFFRRNIIAIGAGRMGKKFAKEILERKGFYFNFVGFIDKDEIKVSTSVEEIPVLGTLKDLDSIVYDNRIDEIFITIESISYDDLLSLIELLRDTGCQVNLVSSHFNVIEKRFDAGEFRTVKSVPIFSSVSPMYGNHLKRIFDICLTLIILIILSPFLIISALLVKFTSKGPIFYRSKVIGKEGEIFTWYKFRTMYADTDTKLHEDHLKHIILDNASVEKLKNDPRITWIGKILRKFSIDEFPQLFNVLKGQMSLVGPRPCLQYEYELMEPWQQTRVKVSPGMTGLWQVSGRNDKEITFKDSVILDLYYADNVSFWLDLKILVKTIPAVVIGKGGK